MNNYINVKWFYFVIKTNLLDLLGAYKTLPTKQILYLDQQDAFSFILASAVW